MNAPHAGDPLRLTPRPPRGPLVIALCVAVAVVATAATHAVGAATDYLERTTSGLPDPLEIVNRPQTRTTRITAADGETVYAVRTFDEDRDARPFADFPPLLADATVSTEDRTFWANRGVDGAAVIRAAISNARAGETVSGASTITQQAVKLLLGDASDTVARKIREAVAAREISAVLSKEEIMGVYLNTVYYGRGAYGAAAAARRLFGRRLDQLTRAQITLMAGLPQSPSHYDPFVSPERAKARQLVVLAAIVRDGHLTAAESEAIADAPWELVSYRAPLDVYPQLADRVTEEAVAIFAALDPEHDPVERLRTCGCRIITTIDDALQSAAVRIVADELAAHPKADRIGNAAIVAEDPRSGDILAYLGSADPAANTPVNRGLYDHAGVALRAPGSSWKPIVYLSAVERGANPATPLRDAYTNYHGYAPHNAVLPSWKGELTMRNALRDSRNAPAVWTLANKTNISAMIDMATRLGIRPGHLDRDRLGLSAALGVEGVTVREMTEVYSTIAALGVHRASRLVRAIVAADGSVVYQAPAVAAGGPVVDPRDAFSIVDILRDNTNPKRGWLTGRRGNVGRPAILKTGTASDIVDTYAMGGTPSIVVGVWYGNSDRSSMGVMSMMGPLPTWARIVKAGLRLRGTPADEDWAAPAGMTRIQMCADDSYNGYSGTGRAWTTACTWGKSPEWIRDDRLERVGAPALH